jgi:hypothetical protein
MKEDGSNIRVKAPGTPAMMNFPSFGKVTELPGADSQSDAGAAGRVSPAERDIFNVE